MHSPKWGLIYIVENKINNKKYVGKTEKLAEDRLKEHLRLSKKSKMVFHKALVKYGIENFRITYFKVPVDNLNKKEIELIGRLRTKVPFGYNMTDGGDGAKLFGKNNGMYKKKLSEQHKAALKSFLIGHKCSEETKRKMSLNNGMLNKKHKEASKSNMRKNSPFNKKVLCIETGKIYNSVKEAYRLTGVLNVCISLACRGVHKTAGKLHWSFCE